MKIEVEKVQYPDIEALRDLDRAEAGCQIVLDSALRRGLADPYLARVNGTIAAYARVWNARYEEYKDRLTEYYTLPSMRGLALPIFREILGSSGAKSIGAQTNMPLMLLMLFDCATNITTEKILFHDAFTTNLAVPGAVFRRVTEVEGEGDWAAEVNGAIVATGGAAYHYNSPYGDIYMEVDEPHRRQGYGSFLVQELKRICYENGKKPAARCNPANTASRLTLQKAGFLPCAQVLVGEVTQPP